MDGISLIQDLAIVLLAAGIAGAICRRLGLSVIVGYLVAGMVVGPYTPPFALVSDVTRIQTLSQIGLVFLMFAIGLGLSISKLGRMGWPTLLATGVGAFLVLNLTKVLGVAVGWTPGQTLFIAAMFMVSSSAVIAKMVGELNLGHERAAQMALTVTILEDVVAVIMLTILGAQAGTAERANLGALLTGMSAFVVLLVLAGLLMVPRLLRRLEARADPELQTVIVAGVLFLLAVAAARAGYSLALGAFLLGAIVAEIPQRNAVDRSFSGMRDLFSSVFFVSIGMMIEVRLLAGVWPAIIGFAAFALIGRAVATGLALVLCGTRPSDARRAALLLGPLGEFSFIIAQLGVSSAVLPREYYPIAVGTSILTVLSTPLLNRHADAILRGIDRIEPRWVTRTLAAYHGWFSHVQNSPTSSMTWKLVRSRLLQSGLEMLFVTGVMIFSDQILTALLPSADSFGLSPRALSFVFWGLIIIIVLIPLVAVWRNVSAIALILCESLTMGTRMPASVVGNSMKAVGAVLLAYWLYAIVPTARLGGWGWAVLALVALVVVAVFSRRLIYWHSQWQVSVRDVLADPTSHRAALAEAARDRRLQDLQSWDLHLGECVIPEGAPYSGQSLADLALPSRHGCAVIEVERNGHVITAMRPDLRLYSGDKLLLLGTTEKLHEARRALETAGPAPDDADEFRGSILESFTIPTGAFDGHTLAELNVAQRTGTRIVGIQRGDQKLIAPSGAEKLHAGDNVLVAGTMAEIASFRGWLNRPEERRDEGPETKD